MELEDHSPRVLCCVLFLFLALQGLVSTTAEDNVEDAREFIDIPCIAEIVRRTLSTNPCDTEEGSSARLLELYNVTNEAMAACNTTARIRVRP